MSSESNYSVECHTCFSSNSRFGMVSILLGVSVCFSTLWRFPYQVANFGGAGYILIYLIMMALFVFPALTSEFGLGRFTRRGPDGAYTALKMPGGKMIAVILFGVVLAVGSYFVIWIGWILRYGISSVLDSNLVNPATNSNQYFDSQVASDPILQIVFAVIVLLLIAPTILGGTKKIESLSKAIVPIFYLMVIGLTFLIIIQPGVLTGIFNFLTSLDIATQITPFTFIAALGQAFFSLCLGGTYMVLYASYMEKKHTHNIPGNALLTLVGNTLASLIAVVLVIGVVIMSGITTTDGLASFGPGLFFGVIPEAFQEIGLVLGGPLSALLMAAFFIMFFFSAYLPMAAIVTVTTTAIERSFGIKRRTAFLLIAGSTLLLAIPSALSPLDGGFLYNLDIFVGAIGSVIGSIIAMIAFAWFIDKKVALEEINIGSRIKLGNFYHFTIKYLAPFFMIFVVLYALADVVLTNVGLNALQETDYVLYQSIIDITPILATVLLVFVAILAIGQSIITKNRKTSS